MIVALDEVTLAYDDRVVLSNLSFQVEAGQSIALRGRNGAGKSTLLRCIAGLLQPRRGTVSVDGRVADETKPWFRRVVAALLDDAAWYPSLTVAEHVDLIRVVNGPAAESWWSPADLTERLGLAAIAHDSPARLSSGQRQRLALAMTFARPSKLLLLDEPERHLDPAGRAAVTDLVAEYVGGGGSVLTATHDSGLADACEVVMLDDVGSAATAGGRTRRERR